SVGRRGVHRDCESAAHHRTGKRDRRHRRSYPPQASVARKPLADARGWERRRGFAGTYRVATLSERSQPEPLTAPIREWLGSGIKHVTLREEMLPDLKLVIRLQDIDSKLAEVQREIDTLPKHIAEIEKKLISHERKLEADRAALSANQKERKKCEGDIQIQEQKISKLKDQMLQAKTNDQYRAFQNEIDFCQKEIRKFEDRILELMGESEPLDRNVKTAETALKAEKAQVEGEKQQARERTAADQAASNELQAERASLVKEMTPAVYQRYERVRKG